MLPPAPGGCAREHAILETRNVLARGARAVGVDPSGQHGVDLDVVLRPIATRAPTPARPIPPLPPVTTATLLRRSKSPGPAGTAYSLPWLIVIGASLLPESPYFAAI